MADANGRRIRPLRVGFTVPLTWLISAIVLGLVQFGIFWQEFRDHSMILADMRERLAHAEELNTTQQQRLLDYDRRISVDEGRIQYLETRRR